MSMHVQLSVLRMSIFHGTSCCTSCSIYEGPVKFVQDNDEDADLQGANGHIGADATPEDLTPEFLEELGGRIEEEPHVTKHPESVWCQAQVLNHCSLGVAFASVEPSSNMFPINFEHPTVAANFLIL